MLSRCSAPTGDAGLVRGLLETADCNVREAVQGGYDQLFGAGSPVAAALTAMLTLYVAFIGYRLLTGRGALRMGDLPGIAIKLGAVMLLTTSWSGYQQLVFNVLFQGPAEIADTLLRGMPGPTGAGGASDVYARLQGSFDGMVAAGRALATLGEDGTVQQAPNVIIQPTEGMTPEEIAGLSPVIQMRSALQGGPAFGAAALWVAAITMLVSTLGLLILCKLMLGLLLAIGPLFVGFLLFETTKGLFEGWLRTALGFALAPLATVVFMAALLGALSPSLAAVEAARVAQRYDLDPILTILVIVLTFTAVFLSVMGMCMRLVAGFRLPAPPVRESEPVGAGSGSTSARTDGGAGGRDPAGAQPSFPGLAGEAAAAGALAGGRDRRDLQIAAAALAAMPGGQGSWSGGSDTGSDRRSPAQGSEGPGTGPLGSASGEGLEARLGQSGWRRANPARRLAPVPAAIRGATR
jgi:type IV secretion system protein VirB6